MSAQTDAGYVDIGTGDAHYDNVVFLAARGVLEGTDCGEGRFCPGEAISRRTFAVWLVRVLDNGAEPTRPAVSPFADVEVTDTEAGFIARLAELGVTTGCAVDPLRFCPDQTVTRGQMASFLVRAFDMPRAAPAGFVDVPAGNVHAGSIDRLAAAGVTAGCATDPARFCPGGRTTRAQMASFLARAIRWVDSQSAGFDPFVTPSLSGLDLERLAEAVATLDPKAACPEVDLPASYDDVVEVARIDRGCAFVEYVPLDGRTVEEVRAGFVSDPTVFAVSRPVTRLVPDTSHIFEFDDPSLEQWHLPELAADELWSGWPSGSHVSVAVIDDGVDGKHRDLSNNVSRSGDPCHSNPYGDHGTHVAGIVAAEQGNSHDVAGVAPDAEILPVKTFFGGTKDVHCANIVPTFTQAVNLARLGRADVINLSFSADPEADYPGIDAPIVITKVAQAIGTDTLQWAIRVATMQNVVVVASGGNCGDNTQWTDANGNHAFGWEHQGCAAHNQDRVPASYPEVIAVAATDSDRNRAAFSTSNSDVDIAAPGHRILSTVRAYTAGPDDPCPSTTTCQVQVESGTSMSAPVVSAVVAHMKARYPQATVNQIMSALYTTADDKGQGRTDDLGHGIVDPAAAIRELHRLITGESLPETIPAVGGDQAAVILAAGDSAQGQPGCSSPHCRNLDITLQNALEGDYTVACWSSRDPQQPWHTATWHWPTSTNWSDGGCWYGYPDEQVWVVVSNAHGTARSNTLTWPGTTTATVQPTTPRAGVTAGVISAGWVHSCGVRTDGTVECWGNNAEGQATAPAGSFTQVSAAAQHSCGVRTDGTVECWTRNVLGRATAPAGSFTQVSAAVQHSCGLRTDQSVECWGNNRSGQTTAPSGSFTQVSANGFHSCGLRTDGTVECWGNNAEGQTAAPSGSFTQVSAGGHHSCALRTDETVECWGNNQLGQATAPSGSFTQVSAGLTHSCGLRTDRSVECWGNNQLGQATAPSGSFTQVSAGGHHSCGLRVDGSVECWGRNDDGETDVPAGTFGTPDADRPTVTLTKGDLRSRSATWLPIHAPP
ncbi:MAG: S8 family serine peptidase [bacterium]|nr:S8 family serine peptidase [bacterium]MDE0377174.1 S8 family serine peptidase [bacterium]